MASEDVLKRAEDWLRTGAKHSVVGLIHDLAAEVRTLRARAEAAEQLAVWVARKGVMVGHDECVRPCVWFDVHRGVEHDGTDAGILAALRGAMGGDGGPDA